MSANASILAILHHLTFYLCSCCSRNLSTPLVVRSPLPDVLVLVALVLVALVLVVLTPVALGSAPDVPSVFLTVPVAEPLLALRTALPAVPALLLPMPAAAALLLPLPAEASLLDAGFLVSILVTVFEVTATLILGTAFT